MKVWTSVDVVSGQSDLLSFVKGIKAILIYWRLVRAKNMIMLPIGMVELNCRSTANGRIMEDIEKVGIRGWQ